MKADYQGVLDRVHASPLRGFALREYVMTELSALPGFDWSGIYVLQGSELVLDAFVGAPTDHTRIAIGVGVCGSAVRENRNKVIADVREEANYLACSLQTRSEIVVLIRDGDRVLGQIDIDGHEVGRFGEPEERFLDALAEDLASRWSE